MNNVIRFWNRNRKMVIFGVIVLVFLIIIVHVLNDVVRNKNIEKEQNRVELTEEEKKLPTKSTIGADDVPLEQTKENVTEIDEFIEKCNNGDSLAAYNMLTDACKEEIFPTLETFEDGYRSIIFATKRIADISNFTSDNNRYIYLVKFYEDSLTTGQTQNTNTYQDYITIDKNSENGKLNLKGLIYKKEINKESEKNGIKIIVESQVIYKDNEKYNLRIENATNKTIAINTGERTKSIYVIGSNNVTYNSNIVELASSLYQIPSYMYRTYNLSFRKSYSAGVKTIGMVFSDIVDNYELYKQNTEEEKDKTIITVSF